VTTILRYGIFSTCIILNACVFIIQDNNTAEHKDSLISVDSLKALKDIKDSVSVDSVKKDSVVLVVDTVKSHSILVPGSKVNTKGIPPEQVVAFAKTLVGTPYRYASMNPAVGFDCSGFVTYVFNHFNIQVPRSSIDFTHVGDEVQLPNVKAGDLILFTGTDSTERFVGHMGIVVDNQNGQLNFIHSSSGKAHGVTITPLNGYYRGRYMKTIRIFPQNY
jgi:hypothetical protein